MSILAVLSKQEASALEPILKLISQYDLSSYRQCGHFCERTSAFWPQQRAYPYAEPSGSGSYLVWQTDHGNFHLQRAALCIFYRLDLRTEQRDADSIGGASE